MTALRRFGAPLAIYAVTRILAAAFVLLAAPHRAVPLESLAGYHWVVVQTLPPDYADVMTSWDGQWYWDIAEDGYPDSALDAQGRPTQTSLAFFPLYPMLVRAVMTLTGAGFHVAGPTTSLVIGAAAVLMVYVLVERCVDRRRALATVTLLCSFASAPILQAAYTESLALLLVASALLLLHERRYLWCLVPVVLLGLTRNIAVVLAPVVVFHWICRVREMRRHPSRRHDRSATIAHLKLCILAVSTLGAAATWPLVTAWITGERDAYLKTLQAWPGFTGSVLLPPWLDLASSNAALLSVILGVGLAGAATIWRTRARFTWGPELTGWAVAYPAYLFSVTSATFSILRYLLLAFPLALIWTPDSSTKAGLRGQRALVALLALAGLALQGLWSSRLLVFTGPNGGWGFP